MDDDVKRPHSTYTCEQSRFRNAQGSHASGETFWVLVHMEIFGYPFLAEYPPGIPVFGHCFFFSAILPAFLFFVKIARRKCQISFPKAQLFMNARPLSF